MGKVAKKQSSFLISYSSFFTMEMDADTFTRYLITLCWQHLIKSLTYTCIWKF